MILVVSAAFVCNVYSLLVVSIRVFIFSIKLILLLISTLYYKQGNCAHKLLTNKNNGNMSAAAEAPSSWMICISCSHANALWHCLRAAKLFDVVPLGVSCLIWRLKVYYIILLAADPVQDSFLDTENLHGFSRSLCALFLIKTQCTQDCLCCEGIRRDQERQNSKANFMLTA